MQEFTQDGFKTLMEAIKHSNVLPSGPDRQFYKVSDTFNTIMNNESNEVLRLMNQIMKRYEIDSNIKNRILDDKTELVVEANDVILEKVANNIDEMNGVRKTVPEPVLIQTVSAQMPLNGSWNRTAATTFVVDSALDTSSPSQAVDNRNVVKLITAKNIVAPQKYFKDKVDNRNNVPWCPRIKDKPNSLKPLAIFLEEYEDRQEYSHPYELELERFVPHTDQLVDEVPLFPKAIADTPLIEIDTPEQLVELVEELRHCKEFAVDVEHHSYRSFMGITCLIQISTEDKDYIIDALALRDTLCLLNEVFTKPSIVKVFHGSDNDITWLQRDLSLYVVNMFDTYQAAKMLEYSALSLAFLLRKFCNVLPNKQFQLADWRIRPLPEALKNYAREDTHYLIYIYKMLKRELLGKNFKLLELVIRNSTEVCKKRYFKPILEADTYLELYRKSKKMFDNRQLFAFKEMFAWRDNLAREVDESLGYVLPSHMLLQIAEALPREMQGILACCNPIPPLVRSHLLDLHKIILSAREQLLEKAIMKEETTGRGVLKRISKVNINNKLHCPHDLSRSNDFRDDLPTVIGNKGSKIDNQTLLNVTLPLEERTPGFLIFANNVPNINKREMIKKNQGFIYLSPYQRYQMTKQCLKNKENKIKQELQDQEINEIQTSNAIKVEKQLQEVCETERTDEQRIASIRDHFLQLSQKFSEDLEIQKKADEEVKRKQEERRKRKFEFISEEPNHGSSTIEATALKLKIRGPKNKGKKRKFNEVDTPAANQANMNQVVDNAPPRPKKKRKNKNRCKQQSDTNMEVQINERRNSKQNLIKNKQQQSRNINRNQRGLHHNNRNAQQKQFVPYDYASVDFRQFQGGAGSATNAVEMKQKFRGKKGRKMGRAGAKSANFSNRGSRGTSNVRH